VQCRSCGAGLDRPGDYCLVCRSANAEAVVVDLGRERATLTPVAEEAIEESVVTTVPEDGDGRRRELRNYAGRIADEVHRRRPEAVYAAGDRDVLAALRPQLHQELYRVPDDRPVEHVLERRGEAPLETVEAPLSEKLGGSHSTLIGGRTGRRVLRTVADHPNVKKVVPGPIDAGGSGSRGGPAAKVTRADTNGNVRLLVRDGSSVQENRVVTTAYDRETGERVRTDLNDALQAAGLGPE
jgi:hypothetical protein